VNRRIVIAGIMAAAAIAMAATRSNPLLAASSLIVADDEIRIVVPIEIDGGSDELVGKWSSAIDEAWNRGNGGEPFVYCGRPVRFVPIFKVLPDDGNGDPGYHSLGVQEIRPGQYFVSNVLHTRGTSPTAVNRHGFIASNASDATVAHEFGHYLGLADEYVENDANGNGIRDHGELTTPNTALYSDAVASLMATTAGRVFSRQVDAALKEHGIDDQLQCPLEIRVKGIYTTAPVGGCNTDRATIKADIVAEGRGLDAQGSGRIQVTWRPVNRCPATLFGGYRPLPGSPPELTVDASFALQTGHTVTVTTSGNYESYFIQGGQIGTGNFLLQWPGIVKGTNARGTLASFDVPYGQWTPGAVFRFENREGTLGPRGDMRLFGSATLEICRSSAKGVFAGCGS
jgi:hypothetical protein